MCTCFGDAKQACQNVDTTTSINVTSWLALSACREWTCVIASEGERHDGSGGTNDDAGVTGEGQRSDLLEKFEGFYCVSTAGKQVFEDIICD